MSNHGEERSPAALRARVKGWGADLDPKNRPAVPREAPSDVETLRGPVGAKQVPEITIHKSTEQPDLTPVFGTSCPPRGLSGKMRDLAYTFSEGRIRRWLILMAADRVDSIEGVFEDLGRGKVPNTYHERGWRAEGSGKVRLDRDIRVAIGLSIIGAVVAGVIVARRER